ncbi:MAG: NUDIX hydrolase [Pseudomonadota bacterium]
MTDRDSSSEPHAAHISEASSPDGSGSAERFARRVPAGDDRTRLVCNDCGFVAYENPKIVVGSVATWEGGILLCRRAIPPREGYWTLPAGYLELNESTADGARREALEEAGAELEIDQLLAVYSIPRLSQVQLIYRARLLNPDVEAGIETQELDIFDWPSIPWDDLAFPSVHWALGHYAETRDHAIFAPRSNPPGEEGNMPRIAKKA